MTKVLYRIGNNVAVVREGKVRVGTIDKDGNITTVGELPYLKEDWNITDVRKAFTEYLKGLL